MGYRMSMDLNEALDTLNKAGVVVERMGWKGAPTTRYGNSTGHAAYTYRKPTKDRKYIKILQCLLDGGKTKAEVHAELGLPDPTAEVNGHASNYYSSVWQELRRAGLVDFEREDGKTVWFITPRGMDLVDEANGIKTDGV